MDHRDYCCNVLLNFHVIIYTLAHDVKYKYVFKLDFMFIFYLFIYLFIFFFATCILKL